MEAHAAVDASLCAPTPQCANVAEIMDFRQGRPVSPQLVRALLYLLLQQVKGLHQSGYAHTRISPETVQVWADGGAGEPLHSSSGWIARPSQRTSSRTPTGLVQVALGRDGKSLMRVDATGVAFMKGRTDSLAFEFSAPETRVSGPHCLFAADAWSCGACAWYLLTGAAGMEGTAAHEPARSHSDARCCRPGEDQTSVLSRTNAATLASLSTSTPTPTPTPTPNAAASALDDVAASPVRSASASDASEFEFDGDESDVEFLPSPEDAKAKKKPAAKKAKAAPKKQTKAATASVAPAAPAEVVAEIPAIEESVPTVTDAVEAVADESGSEAASKPTAASKKKAAAAKKPAATKKPAAATKKPAAATKKPAPKRKAAPKRGAASVAQTKSSGKRRAVAVDVESDASDGEDTADEFESLGAVDAVPVSSRPRRTARAVAKKTYVDPDSGSEFGMSSDYSEDEADDSGSDFGDDM